VKRAMNIGYFFNVVRGVFLSIASNIDFEVGNSDNKIGVLGSEA
jgi:hypothetical protein